MTFDYSDCRHGHTFCECPEAEASRAARAREKAERDGWCRWRYWLRMVGERLIKLSKLQIRVGE